VVKRGYISGNTIRVWIVFNSGGYVGTQVNTGTVDCQSRTMEGTWVHIGGFSLRGTWSAIQS
jgi:hypothetical protein